MGNDQSVGMDVGLTLQSEGDEHLWSLQLNRGKTGEGEGVGVFTRTRGSGTQDDLCRAGLEHLRLLRHPNVVKFLGTQESYDELMIVTEPVIPVSRVLEEMSVEGLVMGWRGVACALDFLHSKAKISHNNLNEECVYVSTVDSQWKVGGFEAARHFKKIDSTFLSDISSIRNEKVIPPEDKGKVKPSDVPCHSRDIWAFGQLMLVLLEDTALEGHMDIAVFDYIRETMLHSDPHLRPIASEVLSQPFMRNVSSELCDFLSKLTLKSRQEKDKFFLDLPRQLYSLPQAVVAEHIVPLLINPLVMAEPLARDSLWKHLLLPISNLKPRQHKFDSSHPCPLLEKDLFHAHILPLLLNLLESRELHVRMTLLSHLPSFANIIAQQELVNTVLPEVLVGLKDTRGEVVSATLHTLAELVPLLGPEAVIGTSRRQVFVDSQPRTKSLPVVLRRGRNMSSQNHVTEAPPTGKVTPHSAPKSSREERKERMKQKREQQQLKKMAQSKLGRVADPSSRPLLGGGGEEEDSVENSDGEAPAIMLPSSDSAPQYSPSVSHDEREEEEEEKWEGLESPEKASFIKEDSDKDFSSKEEDSPTSSNTRLGRTTHHKTIVVPSMTSTQANDEGDSMINGESEDDWGGFEDNTSGDLDIGGWGSAWREGDSKIGSVASSQSPGYQQHTTPLNTPTSPAVSGSGRLKLSSSKSKRNSSTSSETMATSTPTEKSKDVKSSSRLSSSKTGATSKLEKQMKGRLKREDIERLEQQAVLAAAEPDFFADMAPTIGSTNNPPTSGVKKMESVAQISSISTLQYQPSSADQDDAEGWGDEEDWDNF